MKHSHRVHIVRTTTSYFIQFGTNSLRASMCFHFRCIQYIFIFFNEYNICRNDEDDIWRCMTWHKSNCAFFSRCRFKLQSRRQTNQIAAQIIHLKQCFFFLESQYRQLYIVSVDVFVLLLVNFIQVQITSCFPCYQCNRALRQSMARTTIPGWPWNSMF